MTTAAFEALKTQKQKALEMQKWARKHPQEYRELMKKSTKVAKEQYLASLRAKEQTLAQEQWEQQIREQYPSPRYDVTFIAGQAKIQERPLVGPPTVEQWRAGVREQYPSPKYDVTFNLAGEAEIKERPLYGPPRPPPQPLVETFGLITEPYSPGQREREMGGAWPQTKTEISYQELREIIDIPKGKPATTPLGLRRQEYQLRQFIGPQLISLKKAKVKRLSEELYARGDPFGFFASGFVSAGETTMELVFPHPTGVTPVHHDIFALPGQPPPFIVGRVFGEVVTAVTLGKMFEGPLTLAGEGIKKIGAKVVPKTVQSWVKFGPVAKTATAIKSKLPTLKGSRIDVWLTKHSQWYYKKTGGIAVQEVVQPAGIRVFDTATGKVVERVGVGYLSSSQIAWALAGTKRTSGISISKTFVEPLKPSLKHLFYRGGKLTVGYLSELGFKKTAIETVAEQRALTPIVTQTHITRMGIIPTIGKLPTTTTMGKDILKQTAIAFGISLGAKLRLKPKLEPLEWQPTLARERVKFRTLSLEKLEQKQRQLLAFPKLQMAQLQYAPTRQIFRPKLKERQALKLPSLTLPRVVAKQEQKLVVTPKLVQIPKFVYPSKLVPPTLTPPIPPPFRTPRGGADVSRGAKGLFGRFFKREHPIKSAKEMWETFTGKKKRKAKSKGRRRKRRRK